MSDWRPGGSKVRVVSRLVIAIDGPAGAGKSTVAKILARRLGLRYLDTGAMYRALALAAQRNGLNENDGEQAAQLDLEISFGEGDPQRVFLGDEDVSEAIRTPEIGELASALSTHSAVRQLLAERQKAIVAEGGAMTPAKIGPSKSTFSRHFMSASTEKLT